jgi:hypothetical protein
MDKNSIDNHHITCKNCNNQFTGNYCNICGQKASTHRLNLAHILHDFFHALTHVDKGFLFSAKELIIRPGHSIREYIEGKRLKLSNPLLMILIVGGLCSWLYSELDLQMVNSVRIKSLDGPLHYLVSKFFAVNTIFQCIFYAFFDYLLFSYKRYNYMELFVLNLFTATEVLFLYILLIPIWFLGQSLGINNIIRIFLAFLFLVYLIFVRYQFFVAKDDKKVKIRLSIESVIFASLIAANIWRTLNNQFA